MGKDSTFSKQFITDIADEVFHLRPVKRRVSRQVIHSDKGTNTNLGHLTGKRDQKLTAPANTAPASLSVDEQFVISPHYRYDDNTGSLVEDLFNLQTIDQRDWDSWPASGSALNSFNSQSNNTEENIRDEKFSKSSISAESSSNDKISSSSNLDNAQPQVQIMPTTAISNQGFVSPDLNELKTSLKDLVMEVRKDKKQITSILKAGLRVPSTPEVNSTIDVRSSRSELEEIRKSIRALAEEVHTDNARLNAFLRSGQLTRPGFTSDNDVLKDIKQSLCNLNDEIRTENREILHILEQNVMQQPKPVVSSIDVAPFMLHALEEVRESIKHLEEEFRETNHKGVGNFIKNDSAFQPPTGSDPFILAALEELRQSVCALGEELTQDVQQNPALPPTTNSDLLDALEEIRENVNEIKEVVPMISEEVEDASGGQEGMSEDVDDVLNEIRSSLRALENRRPATKPDSKVIPIIVKLENGKSDSIHSNVVNFGPQETFKNVGAGNKTDACLQVSEYIGQAQPWSSIDQKLEFCALCNMCECCCNVNALRPRPPRRTSTHQKVKKKDFSKSSQEESLKNSPRRKSSEMTGLSCRKLSCLMRILDDCEEDPCSETELINELWRPTARLPQQCCYTSFQNQPKTCCSQFPQLIVPTTQLISSQPPPLTPMGAWRMQAPTMPLIPPWPAAPTIPMTAVPGGHAQQMCIPVPIASSTFPKPFTFNFASNPCVGFEESKCTTARAPNGYFCTPTTN